MNHHRGVSSFSSSPPLRGASALPVDNVPAIPMTSSVNCAKRSISSPANTFPTAASHVGSTPFANVWNGVQRQCPPGLELRGVPADGVADDRIEPGGKAVHIELADVVAELLKL